MAEALARRVARFGRTVERVLMVHREAVLDRQYLQERIAYAAIALVTSACTLARWDRSEQEKRAIPAERSAAELYLRMANRRFDDAMRSLSHNDDRLTTVAANDALRMWADYQAAR
jgi:hypothetical protein